MKTRPLVIALVGIGIVLLITAYLLHSRKSARPQALASATSMTPAPLSSPTSSPTPEPPTPSGSTPTLPATSAPPPSTDATGTDHTEADPYTPGPPTEGEHDAVTIAVEFATRFARPQAGVTPQQWWTQVAALMTSQAQSDYRDIDPATIPYTAVTGAGAIQPSGADHSDLVTLVQVPTTAGTYLVHLRIDPTRGWAVNQVTAPPRRP